MALTVFDFYSKDKVCVVRRGNFLLNNAIFYILIKKDGDIKELSVSVPKRYHFINAYSKEDFRADKRDEYNVLSDFLKYNKDSLRGKWELNREDFMCLLRGLEEVLIESYSNSSWIVKLLLKGVVYFKYFCRGLREC